MRGRTRSVLFSIAVLLLVIGVKSFLYLGKFLVHCLEFGNELGEELGYSLKEVEFCLCHILISFADTKVSKKIDITKFLAKKIPCISARDFSPFSPIGLVTLPLAFVVIFRWESNLGFWDLPFLGCYSVHSPFLGSESPLIPCGWLGLFPFRITKIGIIFLISKSFFIFFHYATQTIL